MTSSCLARPVIERAWISLDELSRQSWHHPTPRHGHGI